MSKAQQKITFIGPIAPYRGGVAHYNTQLFRSARAINNVTLLSFKRLYPKWLYPGSSDKESKNATFNEPGVEYVLDCYSPLSWSRAVKKIIASKSDVVVITWWTLFWQPALTYMTTRLRKKGIKVIYFCHNLTDHSASRLTERLSESMLKQADGYIVHSQDLKNQIRSIFPDAKVLTRQHPVYNQFPRSNVKLEKRGRLELLFFGFIRPYKGLDILLEALARLNDEKVFLTVAGEPWENGEKFKDHVKQIKAPNVELHLGYVNDADIAKYFERADVVVLPYLSATGSGIVATAYNYEKPVLATRVGGLAEAVIPGHTGWLVEPNNPSKIVAAIKDITRKEAQGYKKGINNYCKDNSWENMARAIKDFTGDLK